jgi:hypothetical protein
MEKPTYIRVLDQEAIQYLYYNNGIINNVTCLSENVYN